jgi:hypothetical protein
VQHTVVQIYNELMKKQDQLDFDDFKRMSYGLYRMKLTLPLDYEPFIRKWDEYFERVEDDFVACLQILCSANTYHQLFDPLIPARFGPWYEQKLLNVLDRIHFQLVEHPHALTQSLNELIMRNVDQMTKHQLDNAKPLTQYFVAFEQRSSLKKQAEWRSEQLRLFMMEEQYVEWQGVEQRTDQDAYFVLKEMPRQQKYLKKLETIRLLAHKNIL